MFTCIDSGAGGSHRSLPTHWLWIFHSLDLFCLLDLIVHVYFKSNILLCCQILISLFVCKCENKLWVLAVFQLLLSFRIALFIFFVKVFHTFLSSSWIFYVIKCHSCAIIFHAVGLHFWMKPSHSTLGKAISVYLHTEELGSPLVSEYGSGTSEGSTVIHSTGGETGRVSPSWKRFICSTIITFIFYNKLTNCSFWDF